MSCSLPLENKSASPAEIETCSRYPQLCAMGVQRWMWALIVLLMLDGAWSWYEDNYRWGHRGRTRRVFSYPRDWDIDWAASQHRALGDWHGAAEGADHGRHRHYHQVQVQDSGEQRYLYQGDQGPGLHPRMVVLPKTKEDTRGLWHSQQRGSALLAPGSEARVVPARGSNSKFYRGTVTSKISDGVSSKKRNHGNRHRNRGSPKQQLWQFSQDEPPRTHHPKSKVCARCPSDRAVLAKKGDTSVIMEVPPIIPCHPWSSVEKVKQEVLAGPEPGSEVPEGSHKLVIRLYRHKRTIVNCVTRYNVIVRKCPVLEVGPAVRTDCPASSSRTWGSVCNISCAPGYQLEGGNTTECGDDLEWTGQTPLCLATTSCPVPVSPDHGHLSCRTPQHQPVPARAKGVLPDGSVCHFRCDPGYTVPPSQQGLTKVRCVGGTWDNHQDPVCVETNELKEEETSPEISPEEALRFDGKGCPEDFCKNKGKCIVILGEPMCSCMAGYSGPTCEDQEEELDPDPNLFNSIT